MNTAPGNRTKVILGGGYSMFYPKIHAVGNIVMMHSYLLDFVKLKTSEYHNSLSVFMNYIRKTKRDVEWTI